MCMSEADIQIAENQLVLRSRLEDLGLVVPWLDGLSVAYAIPGHTRFGIDLCLEEALSNIIRHGYTGEPNHVVTIDFSQSDMTGLTFTIVDNAPHFTPEEQVEPKRMPTSIEEVKPGGLGIHLMKKFATTLFCERLPNGNRLTLGFQVVPAKPADALPV